MTVGCIMFVLGLVYLTLAFKSQTARVRASMLISAPLCIGSNVIVLLLLYAELLYPRMPQSIGGGRPIALRLLLKDDAMSALLRNTPGAAKDALSEPLQLYFRSSSYLLVGNEPDQQLLQIPVDQVRAIIWVESGP